MNDPEADGMQAANGSTALLLAALVLSLLIAIIDFAWLGVNANQDALAAAAVTRAQVASQQLARQAGDAADGNIDAFASLAQTRASLQSLFDGLKKGDVRTGFRGYADVAELAPDLGALDGAWGQLNASAARVLDGKSQVLGNAAIRDEFNSKLAALNARMEEVVKILTEHNGAANSIMVASRQMLYADRMQRRIQIVAHGGEDASAAIAALQKDAQFYGLVLSGLIGGNTDLNIRALDNPNAKAIVGEIDKQWQELAPTLAKILGAGPNLQQVKQAADKASLDSQSLLLKADALSTHIAGLHSMRLFPSRSIGIAGAALAILFAVLLVFKLIRDQRRRYQHSAEVNRRNEAAIQRLLDEMGTLADGDLTVQASVTEDFTGTIADSINYAVEALRSLVTTINDTSVHVAGAANETQATALHLADAAEHQAQQIVSASSAMNEIAAFADTVSKNSVDSAQVAQRSAQIASSGASSVRRSIAGMDTIREQIQETSKRIKRLGESSQEIGSIVELINDLAEQTNILALNAAIQAASAGAAGRGFGVVADEVQQLAERASDATRRIEILVQTIQADTNAAVRSMEQTTSEVVNGAQLTEEAGTRLGEIESVSGDLAGLIAHIAQSAQQQSDAAAKVSATMHVIEEITAQTSTGANQTAASTATLAGLAAELRRSVADFKLP